MLWHWGSAALCCSKCLPGFVCAAVLQGAPPFPAVDCAADLTAELGHGGCRQALFCPTATPPGRGPLSPTADCALDPATDPGGWGVVDAGRLCSIAQPTREGLLSPSVDCAPALPLKPMLAPHLPRCANREPRPRPNKAPQLEIRSLSVPVRGSPLIHIQPYTSAATLSLTFVSPQKGISSLHSYLAQFMYPSSQSATCHFSRCLLSFREYSVCFPLRLLWFKMLWLPHFV